MSAKDAGNRALQVLRREVRQAAAEAVAPMRNKVEETVARMDATDARIAEIARETSDHFDQRLSEIAAGVEGQLRQFGETLENSIRLAGERADQRIQTYISDTVKARPTQTPEEVFEEFVRGMEEAQGVSPPEQEEKAA